MKNKLVSCGFLLVFVCSGLVIGCGTDSTKAKDDLATQEDSAISQDAQSDEDLSAPDDLLAQKDLPEGEDSTTEEDSGTHEPGFIAPDPATTFTYRLYSFEYGELGSYDVPGKFGIREDKFGHEYRRV